MTGSNDARSVVDNGSSVTRYGICVLDGVGI